jgi:WD40 repeat protein
MLVRFAFLVFSIMPCVIAPFRAHAQEKPKIEIVPQLGHAESVASVAFCPDGKTALSGSSDKTLRLWDLATGRLIRQFEGHSGRVTSVAISPDGKTALSGSEDYTLRLWDLATGRLIRKFEGHSAYWGNRSVIFSPDGKTALSGTDHALLLWDLASGREIRKFEGHSGVVTSVAFSPDGKTALSGSYDHTVRLWNVATGREIQKFDSDATVWSVAFSPDGKTALSGGTLRLWDVATGREIRKFEEYGGQLALSGAFSPNGKTVLSGNWNKALLLWDLASGRLIRKFEGDSGKVSSVAFSPDGKTALLGSTDKPLQLWDLATGRLIRKIVGYGVNSVAMSPDGKTALSGGDKTLRLWDLASGLKIREFNGHSGEVTSVAFSPDGKTALSGSRDQTLRLWDLATGLEIRRFEGHSGDVTSSIFSRDVEIAVAFSPEGNTALSVSEDGLRLWDLATGLEIRKFERHPYVDWSVAFSPDGKTALTGGTLRLWDVATGREIRKFEGQAENSVAFSPDGKTALSGGFDHTLRLWDLATGREIRRLEGHSNSVTSVAFSPDGKTALSGSDDSTTRLWDLRRGEQLALFYSSNTGDWFTSQGLSKASEWLTLTSPGFFAASDKGANKLLHVVRGLEVTTLAQVQQSLYNPDLVREALAGDPDGEVERAADFINLDKVIDSGPAPLVEIMSNSSRSTSDTDLVTVAARIKDRGKGIGRIEWRVNGVTTAVSNAQAGSGSEYDINQTLALDPGENAIEVVAYNARNLLASLPAQTTITYAGPADEVKPILYVLAIGINKYVDRGGSVPGETGRFPPLRLAVGDANALVAALQKAGAGLYKEVRVRTVLDDEATAAGIDGALTEMAANISPRDTFVFFVAAHGYSNEGRFYLIPQDYQGGNDPEALARRAIGQAQLQDWIANRIKAKKALILLDTCESGALTNGYAHSRVDGPASEAGVGRLHEATGRPVLTAAAQGQYAHEGKITGTGERRGIFTWAVLDALHNGDTNGDGVIELSELVAHVQKVVPGLAQGLARAVTSSEPVFGVQTPRFGSTGEDFAIARRL